MSEVRVIIQDTLGGQEQVTKQVNTTKGVKTSANAIKEATSVSGEASAINTKNAKAILGAAVVGKQVLNYTTSNVGKWTGNQHNQQVVNDAKEMAGYGMLFAVNPLAAITSLSFRVATTAIDNAWEQKWDNLASQRKLARAGFSSSGEAIGYRRNK